MDTNLTGNEPTKKSGKSERSKNVEIQPNNPLIYVGPNLQGGRLSRFTVFKDGVPAYVNDLLEKQPSIKHLIVPINECAKAQLKSETPGTLEHKVFQEIINERKG